MNNTINKNAIRDRVLEAIKSDQVKMRPKWHFILKAVFAAVGGIILLLSIVYLASFIFFILRQTGVIFVPIFGFRGWYAFLVSIPWLLVLLLLIFIVLLEILARHYSFAYRRPLIYFAIVVLLFVIIGGYIVATTHFHDRMFRYSQRHRLPFAGQMYRGYGEQRFKNIHQGIITEITRDGFIMENRRGETLIIIITRFTRLPLGADFSKGDTVVVFGDRENKTVGAIGIRNAK